MFAVTVKFVSLLAVASVALASPYPGSGTDCSTGTVSCCNTSQSGTLDGLLPIEIPIGSSCTPIDVLGISGQSCSAQTACCDDVDSSGVGINCTPINVGL